MKVPWFGDRCIICLGNDALSEEHVIPAALGGDLKCDFLCKPCNDLFGSSFEAKARTDPAIRIAVANLRSEIPLIHDHVRMARNILLRADPLVFEASSGKGRLLPGPLNTSTGP